jgi:hypothetical protein
MVRFPSEMCVTFFMFSPSNGGEMLACDENGNINEI